MDASPQAGIVPGATNQERLVILAGALAEAGIRELLLSEPGQTSHRFEARRTDLPAALAAAGAGATLSTPDESVLVTLGPSEARYTTSHEAFAQAIARAQAANPPPHSRS